MLNELPCNPATWFSWCGSHGLFHLYTDSNPQIYKTIKTTITKTGEVGNYRYLNSVIFKAVGNEELLYSAGYPPAAVSQVTMKH
jgi:hypothetical protein